MSSILNWKGLDRLRRYRRFCREFLVVPHGYNAGAALEMYPTQVEWVRSIVHADATIITVGKGNAKTATLAAVALWWAADPPPGDNLPEVVIVAGTREQAQQGVYATAVAMLEAGAPWLRDQATIYLDNRDARIVFRRNGGTIRVRAAHPARLHGIIPSLSVLDEIGLVADPKVWQTLVQSTGKRPGSTVVGIGTPGWTQDGNALFDFKVQHDTGQLPAWVAYHEHSANPTDNPDSHRVWRKANPVRAELNPVGWVHDLEVIKSLIPHAEWETFHLARWPSLVGLSVVSKERWSELAGVLELDPLDAPVHVAVDGDWSRRNVAVMAAQHDDGRTELNTLGVWEAQTEAVPVGALADACFALGPPESVTVARSMQASGLVDELEARDVNVAELNTSSAAVMRDPTDLFLTAVTDGSLVHDANELATTQVLAARQDVRRDGIVFIRDDRIDRRIDALAAAAVALQVAVSQPAAVIY